MTTLLLLEDDEALGKTVQEKLQKEGYNTHWAKTLAEATQCIHELTFDLAILDISLPDGDGFHVAREIAERKLDVPFVFLTAMSSAEFRLEAFEIGAYDFIPKPFHMKELLLRLERLLDAKKVPLQQVFPDFTIDHEHRRILFPNGQNTQLPEKDYLLLQYLLRMSPRALNRQQILEQVREAGDGANQRTVDNTVVRLREALGKNGKLYLHSQRGVGYYWLAP